MSHDKFAFGPACSEERHVFGSRRPGYRSERVSRAAVKDWLSFIKKKGIKRICCLLQEWELLDYYEDDLVEAYRKEFGDLNVLTVPVEDFHLAEISALRDEILPFLAESEAKNLPVLVHCSGGSGRTGHVLAAWVVYRYDLPIEEALEAVNRNPREAVQCGNAMGEELLSLLNACRPTNKIG
ncbi:MAG: dual specificity protein phosphatase family protein [Syntrophorhabdaceae bacterium]|nr:dual specificity protein phosphatase family protein [Syntrophorhabdaceae bacterium]HOC46082.1 dual specificity protein phosphatase family protein [Syntrophorhabdaceae bacterium]